MYEIFDTLLHNKLKLLKCDEYESLMYKCSNNFTHRSFVKNPSIDRCIVDGGGKTKTYNRNRTPSEWQSRQTWTGRRQRNVAKAWKRGVFELHAGQCVCGLKMNKLIGRTSYRLCTFSTSIREIREVKYYLRDKKKKEKGGAQKKGGEISLVPPLDPRPVL